MSFWKEVYEESLSETRRQLPLKWDSFRLAIAILWAAIAIGVSVVFGLLHGWATAISLLGTLFGGEIALLFTLWISIPIISFLKLPGVAERVVAAKNKDLQEQKDFVAYLKTRERQANGDLIELRKVEEATWKGIEIFNGERGNPFGGHIQVTEVTGHQIRNPVEILNSDTQQPSFESPSGGVSTMKLIHWPNGENSIPAVFAMASFNPIVFSASGEYMLTTLLSGRFASSYSTPVEIKIRWRFVVDLRERRMSLDKLSDERLHEPGAGYR